MTLKRDWIIERLNRYADFSERGAERGDHDLNPHVVRTERPLRQAAVLVGLVDRPDGITVLLTKRTDHLEHHPGQVSFPGGHIEDDDRDAVHAALRETKEETGVTPDRIEVIGRLDTYITGTGFEVTPVVGLIQPPFELDPDPHEVAEVFEVPLAFLLDPANHHRHSRKFESGTRHFYAMPYADYFIWGATAGMLIDLYQTLTGREARPIATAPARPGIDAAPSSC